MTSLLEHQLVFVTGKGGVGKSTVAAAIGWLGAASGRRTLVVEADGKGDVGAIFGRHGIGFEPVEVMPSLSVMEMDTEASLEEYLRIFVKVPMLSKMPGLARIFDFVSTAAPGVKEILVVGKLCYEAKENHFDLIVVDPPASGHVISQLGVTSDVGDLIQLGMIRNQTSWMLEILADQDRSTAVLVATPDETAVEESVELASRIRSETPVHLGGAVVNRVIHNPLGELEQAELERIRSVAGAAGQLGPVVEAADLYVGIATRHAGNIATLQAAMGELPVATVAELLGSEANLDLVMEVAESLEVELW